MRAIQSQSGPWIDVRPMTMVPPASTVSSEAAGTWCTVSPSSSDTLPSRTRTRSPSSISRTSYWVPNSRTVPKGVLIDGPPANPRLPEST